MDRNVYQQDSLDKRVILDFGTYVFSNSDVNESLVLEQRTNPDGDFILGSANASQLTFEINNLYQLIPDEAVTGKEFVYRAGANTVTESKRTIYNAIRKDVICLNGAIAYAGSQRTPYLSIWDLENYRMLELPEQPPEGVRSLFIINGKLYCGHENAPYLSVYAIQGNGLTKENFPALNDFQVYQIQQFNETRKSFSLAGDILKEYTRELVDLAVTDFVEKTFAFQQAGVFTAEKPERKNDNILAVTSYDRMSKTDVIVDVWNNGLTYPITLGNMLKSLCSWLGIPLATSSFLNSNHIVKERYVGENVSGRQVIQWIAQLAACFADMDNQGRLQLRWYQEQDYTINESSYIEVSASSYETKQIDKVQMRDTSENIGVIVPLDATGANIYIIENNPLVNTQSDAELRPVVERIYQAIKDFSYRPYTVKTVWGNPFIKAGDIVTVTTLKGQTFSAIIMQQKLSGVLALKSEISATGNEVREVQSNAVNISFQRVWDASNKLTRTVDETRSTLSNLKKDTETQFLQTAEQIELRAKKNELVSLINISPERIKISANKLELSGYVTFDNLETEGETTIDGGNIITGRIQGPSGQFYLDLDSGETKISYLLDKNGTAARAILESGSNGYGLYLYQGANTSRADGSITIDHSTLDAGFVFDASVIDFLPRVFFHDSINLFGNDIMNAGDINGGTVTFSGDYSSIIGKGNEFGHADYYCSGTASDGFSIYHKNNQSRFASTKIVLDCDTDVYGDISADNLDVTSDRSKKTDIQDVTFSASDRISELKFYSYRLLKEEKENKPSGVQDRKAVMVVQSEEEPNLIPSEQVEPIGLLWDEAPEEIRRENEDGRRTINLYGYISLVAKAQQEALERIEKLEKRIAELEGGMQNEV